MPFLCLGLKKPRLKSPKSHSSEVQKPSLFDSKSHDIPYQGAKLAKKIEKSDISAY